MLGSCKQYQDYAVIAKEMNLSTDNLSNSSECQDIIYSIPSPHQISILIKDDCPRFDENIFKRFDINRFTTTEKKALALGILGADIGYFSLYDQKEIVLQYLDNIRHLLGVFKFEQYNQAQLLERIEANLENSDSLLFIISEVFRKESKIIRAGEQSHLETLVIAGGWIESFFILNKLYYNSQNSNLFSLLLQQQYVLNNLINSLRPYYKRSNEFTDLVDRLVEIAYEYEVVDVAYKNYPPLNSDSITYIKCKFTPVLSGSHLDKMFELSGSLRNSLIN
jgi:hypothetical protein